jgi:repressor of nif and glnA expression
MTPETDNGHGEILARLREIEVQVTDTNTRVKNMEKRANISLVFKVVWIAFLLGIPFLVLLMFGGFVGGGASSTGVESSQFTNTTDQLNEVLDLYRGQ